MQSDSGLGGASLRIEPFPGPKIAVGDTHQSNPSAENRTGATFHFSEPSVAEAGLSSVQQAAFRAAFDRGLATLKAWCFEMGWQPSSTPPLQVFVSTQYRISRALVPAWEGRAGRMEFPAARVTTGQAAITHELVHVLLPNGNRLLAEGLAIYLQALIGGNPAFPNFGQPLHAVAHCALREMVQMPFDAKGLAAVRLADLECIATPNPLTLCVGETFNGEDPDGQRRLYALAGSFIQFLIETYGLVRFHTLYALTPLVPSKLEAGGPERWSGVYAYPFAALETEWKAIICSANFTEETGNA